MKTKVSDSYTFFTDPDLGFFQYGSGSRLLFDPEPDPGYKKNTFFIGNNKNFVGYLFFAAR